MPSVITDRWFLIALAMAVTGLVLLGLHVTFAAIGAFAAAVALVFVGVLVSQLSGR